MGPTASGKTDLAIQLADKFKTRIISVDCFKSLCSVAEPFSWCSWLNFSLDFLVDSGRLESPLPPASSANAKALG
jgi:hypothetical protein